jgi:hypothetical protein
VSDILGRLFGEPPTWSPAWVRGFREPKDERHLPTFEARLQSRVACNAFIIETLGAPA